MQNAPFSGIGSMSAGPVALLGEHSLASACGEGFGTKNLRRHRSDSEFPELFMDGGFVSDGVVVVAAASGSRES